MQIEYVPNQEYIHCIGAELYPVKITRDDGTDYYTWILNNIFDYDNCSSIQASAPTLPQLLHGCCGNPNNHRYLYNKKSDCPAYNNGGSEEEIEYEMNMAICTECGKQIYPQE